MQSSPGLPPSGAHQGAQEFLDGVAMGVKSSAWGACSPTLLGTRGPGLAFMGPGNSLARLPLRVTLRHHAGGSAGAWRGLPSICVRPSQGLTAPLTHLAGVAEMKCFAS